MSAAKLYEYLILVKTKNKFVQFIRYGFVSLIALLVDVVMLIFLKEVVGFHYLIAATFAFLVGLGTNYSLSIFWVFHSSKIDNKKREIILFSLIGVIGLLITDILLWILTSRIGIYYVISKLITVVIVYFWNFCMRKYYIFN